MRLPAAEAVHAEAAVDTLFATLRVEMNTGEVPRDTPDADEAAWSQALYRQLRSLAHSRLRDGGRNTLLDTTALVHEAFLRMGALEMARSDPVEHRRMLAYASRTMRSVIVDAARARQTEKRGGDACIVTLTGDLADAAQPAAADHIVRVHEALLELEALDPRLARVVEMRYFAGLSDAEIALALDQSERTVRRDWEKARLVLSQALRG